MDFSDESFVVFADDAELNAHLLRVDKCISLMNRTILYKMGWEIKSGLNVEDITHGQFHAYIMNNLHRLE